MDVKSFTTYMMDFYGPRGLYPENFNEFEIGIATHIYKTNLPCGQQEFYGDSIDRERVRDLILQARETVLPEFAAI